MSGYVGPVVTTDAVLVRLGRHGLEALAIKRDRGPFAGRLALPGVYVQNGETISEATARCLSSKVGIRIASQPSTVTVYDAVDRDPRGHSLSIVTVSFITSDECELIDASDKQWVSLSEGETLAFDHGDILTTVAQWLRSHLWADQRVLRGLADTSEPSTSDFRRVVEAVTGEEVGVSNMRRRIESSGIAKPSAVEVARHSGRGRPSAVWSWGD